MIKYIIIIISIIGWTLFCLAMILSMPAYSGGRQYFLPDPKGGVYEVSNDTGSADDNKDWINHKREYAMIPKNDQLNIFNQCNTGLARCYGAPAAYGDILVTVWFWRPLR